MHIYTQCWKAYVIQIHPDALLLERSIYWIEFSFNLHPNLTLEPLTKAQGAFISPQFVISQLCSTLNTNFSLLQLLRGRKISHSFCVYVFFVLFFFSVNQQ